MIERLPARVRTPPVARAMLSPSAFLAAGAAAAGTILLGPLALAPIAAIAAWVARVAMAVPRKAAGDRIDPFTIGDPWRRFVLDAQQAKKRFDETVKRSRTGPLQERLAAIGERIEQGVTECWRIARQGDNLQGGLRQLDIADIDRELEEVRAERGRRPETDSTAQALERTEQALESQRSSYQRLYNVWQDAQSRLRVLNAQLDEAVARAVELSLHGGDVQELSPLGNDVENLVGELEALRQAMEETSGTPNAAAGGVA